MDSFDIQAGGSNHHYGRIAHWLAVALWRRFPDATVNIRVGNAYRDLTAVGDGLARIGVATPGVAARLCLDGNATYDHPRPALRSIGVVPHRDALVLGAVRELGLENVDDIREGRIPLRLSVPHVDQMTGHASRHLLAEHGITREALESWGGRWIDTDSAQDAWKMVAAGDADAMINESIPQSFRPLSKARPIRLLSMRQAAVEKLQRDLGYRWREVAAAASTARTSPSLA